ncbi:Putative uncharacterized protein BCG_3619c, partial [Arthrobacter sp. DR-2P]
EALQRRGHHGRWDSCDHPGAHMAGYGGDADAGRARGHGGQLRPGAAGGGGGGGGG